MKGLLGPSARQVLEIPLISYHSLPDNSFCCSTPPETNVELPKKPRSRAALFLGVPVHGGLANPALSYLRHSEPEIDPTLATSTDPPSARGFPPHEMPPFLCPGTGGAGPLAPAHMQLT